MSSFNVSVNKSKYKKIFYYILFIDYLLIKKYKTEGNYNRNLQNVKEKQIKIKIKINEKYIISVKTKNLIKSENKLESLTVEFCIFKSNYNIP